MHAQNTRRERSLSAAGAAKAAEAGLDAAAGRVAVDLDSLAFARGAHLMTNRKCDLPQGSFRNAQKVGRPQASLVLLCFYTAVLASARHAAKA